MKVPSPIIDIQGKKIGRDYPTYFVADIAANHDGNLERAKDLIYLAAEAGANAAKFQHFQAETIVSDFGFKQLGSQLSHQSAWKKSVFEVYRDASVNLDWTGEIKETCEKAGITYFTTPYSIEVVDFMGSYVPAYKIGSGDITWIEMIEKVASMNKPYILATGASSMDEVYRAVCAGLRHNPNLVLMQCNTNYSADLENFKYIHLNVLRAYKSMYPELVLGLSDHTPGHATVLGAVTLGAHMVEKHFTDDISREGPDHGFSMDPHTWREMVDRTREIENALGSAIKKVEGNEKETVVLQRRALRTKANLPAGHRLTASNLAALRPCPPDATPPCDIEKLLGRSLRRDLPAGECVRDSDLD
jgi:sialic acid synthase SpsE